MAHQSAFDTLFLGQAPELLGLLRTAQVVSSADVTVLIEGESGTGKELLATAIHRDSQRHSKPFIAINCAALPVALVETELFGHRKGSFTGADSDHMGRIRAAHGGTLFLDEIGELPLATQAKLLRFLESGECQAVGETQTYHADVRIIAATNRDLRLLVSEKIFREDLFYRLNVVPLTLPPLRDRTGDIAVLLDGLIAQLAQKHGLAAPIFTTEAITALSQYRWPGNVRELRNLCERLVVLCCGKSVQRQHLPTEIAEGSGAEGLAKIGFSLPDSGIDLEAVELGFIRAALAKTAGNRTHAARLLGLTRDTLLYRMKKHALR